MNVLLSFIIGIPVLGLAFQFGEGVHNDYHPTKIEKRLNKFQEKYDDDGNRVS